MVPSMGVAIVKVLCQLILPSAPLFNQLVDNSQVLCQLISPSVPLFNQLVDNSQSAMSIDIA